MSDTIKSIIDRVSSPKLVAPGPTKEDIDVILQCAVRAPDHGRLKPWRFVVLKGDALVELGLIFEKAALSQSPLLDAHQREKLRAMPLRAPMVVVAIADVIPDHKIPEIEQVVAVGAAVQNIQLSARALGYGVMWRTGPMAYNLIVHKYFDLKEHDKIVGFVYLGAQEGKSRTPIEQSLAECVQFQGI